MGLFELRPEALAIFGTHGIVVMFNEPGWVSVSHLPNADRLSHGSRGKYAPWVPEQSCEQLPTALHVLAADGNHERNSRDGNELGKPGNCQV